MAKRKEDPPAAGAPAWMATFGDLMNLLLCFFVLLFSMSSVDAQKFELIAASFSQTFSIFKAGGTAIGDGALIGNGVSQLNQLDQYMNTTGQADSVEVQEYDAITAVQKQKMEESEELAEKIEESVQEMNLDKEIDVKFTSQYVQLNMRGALLFDSGKANLKEESIPLLKQVGVILEKYAESVIEIEGHTDNVPIHSASFANNNELSSFRALAVFDFLTNNTTLDPGLIKHSGRGEYVPVADNDSSEGRAKNRRVEIKIYHSLSSY